MSEVNIKLSREVWLGQPEELQMRQSIVSQVFIIRRDTGGKISSITYTGKEVWFRSIK